MSNIGAPSHPFDGAQGEAKDRKAGQSKRNVDKIRHDETPGEICPDLAPRLRKGAMAALALGRKDRVRIRDFFGRVAGRRAATRGSCRPERQTAWS